MNDFSFVIFVVNIVLAILLGIVVSIGMVSSPLMEYHNAIKECEKALPRDKHCEITATPKENP
jgi:hypothetical protein